MEKWPPPDSKESFSLVDGREISSVDVTPPPPKPTPPAKPAIQLPAVLPAAPAPLPVVDYVSTPSTVSKTLLDNGTLATYNANKVLNVKLSTGKTAIDSAWEININQASDDKLIYSGTTVQQKFHKIRRLLELKSAHDQGFSIGGIKLTPADVAPAIDYSDINQRLAELQSDDEVVKAVMASARYYINTDTAQEVIDMRYNLRRSGSTSIYL